MCAVISLLQALAVRPASKVQPVHQANRHPQVQTTLNPHKLLQLIWIHHKDGKEANRFLIFKITNFDKNGY